MRDSVVSSVMLDMLLRRKKIRRSGGAGFLRWEARGKPAAQGLGGANAYGLAAAARCAREGPRARPRAVGTVRLGVRAVPMVAPRTSQRVGVPSCTLYLLYRCIGCIAVSTLYRLYRI